MNIYKLILSLAFFATASLAYAADSQENDGLIVSPAITHFGITQLNSDSAVSTIEIENTTGNTISFTSAPIIIGTHADQFNIAGTSCGASLANTDSCNVNVRFRPTSVGSKMAYVSIDTDVSGTPKITAFLSNDEGLKAQVLRRFPAVLSEVKVLKDGVLVDVSTTVLESDQVYTLTWRLLGYDEAYSSYPAFFDCGQSPATTACGTDFSDRVTSISSADILDDAGTAQGLWRYESESAQYYDFSQEFTVASADLGAASGTYYVALRFYQKNAIDTAAKNEAISLLAPSNIIGFSGDPATAKSGYIGNDGRRLFLQVSK